MKSAPLVVSAERRRREAAAAAARQRRREDAARLRAEKGLQAATSRRQRVSSHNSGNQRGARVVRPTRETVAWAQVVALAESLVAESRREGFPITAENVVEQVIAMGTGAALTERLDQSRIASFRRRIGVAQEKLDAMIARRDRRRAAADAFIQAVPEGMVVTGLTADEEGTVRIELQAADGPRLIAVHDDGEGSDMVTHWMPDGPHDESDPACAAENGRIDEWHRRVAGKGFIAGEVKLSSSQSRSRQSGRTGRSIPEASGGESRRSLS